MGDITNNTAPNKKTWRILRQTFPNYFFHGCAAHALHLLVKDIFERNKQHIGLKDKTESENGYPFE